MKAEIQQITANCKTPLEKMEKIYGLLQQKTRYISVQLGIGGWQPFDATYVAEKGYGDCKALSNFTKAMLEVVGIPSYYTIIRAGENATEINPAFPANQFNHAILCVPLPKDLSAKSLWVFIGFHERPLCTNQYPRRRKISTNSRL
jgi:transglutaminase-like putative cysteine protease